MKTPDAPQNPYPSETGCCPRFVPEPWQEKAIHWKDKLFLKDRVRCLFYMPLNFGRVMVRNMARISQAGAFTPEPPIGLSDHTSKWSMDIYIEVTREIPGGENVRLSGSFLSKVFEGPFRNTGQWCQQMEEWVRSKGKAVKRCLMYYTTCPKCARHYGKNYVVILAEV
ncbi:MAG TPA: hypothetical protein PKM73_00195 [Verrucomicrobiota bacterium]|nr:hypothetical protein [Verrucomicrobiota bacterium]HNU49463.1 hypothetical protein [Verrucomicrobiota bacterium]